MTEVLILGIVFLTTFAFVIGYTVDQRSRYSAWQRIVDARRDLVLHETALSSSTTSDVVVLETNLDRHWALEGRVRESLLLLKLAEIETEAGRVLDDKLGPARRQLFQLRSELKDHGFWTDEDLETFDRAMKVRNSIVHGGSNDTSVAASDVPAKALDRILAKLRTA